MTVLAVRRVVVGVDGSVESAAALRWGCREARLRGAEVHAVYAWEAPCHSVASYAVPAQAPVPSADALWGPVLGEHAPGVQIRTEVTEGLAARVLLDRCIGADMLVLGSSSDMPGSLRAAGPVIRACLRRAPCPVVVITEAMEGASSPAGVPARAGVPAGAYA
jgi:nucleotide-binding universal stress UspA family protein